MGPGAIVQDSKSEQINFEAGHAHVAQVVEHRLGKAKVPGSNPGVGSKTSRSLAPVR